MSNRWNELLMDDHRTTERVLAALKTALAESAGPAGPAPAVIADALDYLGNYADRCHNQKEERHLFPLLERRGIPRHAGPLAVMLGEHDTAKRLVAEFERLGKAFVAGDARVLGDLRRVFGEYAALLQEHYWKENDILYPLALRALAPGDDAAIVAGIAEQEALLGPGGRERYYALAERIANAGSVEDLSLGLDRGVLAAILNTLPVEISFVDANDTVRYFSHENQKKIFPRLRSAIGTPVQNCHPEKSLHMVEQILADFRSGERTCAEFWLDFQGMKVHVRYFAVREAGRYLGTLEVVQDVTEIQRLRGEKRLLD
jgi:DUF438 domain-containing protein